MVGDLYIILGPTGAGKSTQAQLLAAAHGWQHLSSGQLLRDAHLIGAHERSGHLAPDADVEGVVGNAVVNIPLGKTVLLDGFPRTISEGQWLEGKMKEWGRELRGVIVLDVAESTLRARLQERDRSDDSSAAIDAKLKEYREKTSQLIEYFAVTGLVHSIPGEGTPEQVQAEIRRRIAQ